MNKRSGRGPLRSEAVVAYAAVMASMKQEAFSSDRAASVGVERPHWAFWVAILGGMSLVSALACSERAYELWAEYMGRWLPQPVIQGIFVAGWGAHVLEALHARKLALELGLSDAERRGWTLQTFLLGFPSLGKLLRRRAAAR